MNILRALVPAGLFAVLASAALACGVAHAQSNGSTGTGGTGGQQQGQGCQPCKGLHTGSFVWVNDASISQQGPVESLVQAIDPSTCISSIVTVDPSTPMALVTRTGVALGQVSSFATSPSVAALVLTQ